MVAAPPRASAPISVARYSASRASLRLRLRVLRERRAAPSAPPHPQPPPLPAKPGAVAGCGAQHDDEGVVDVLQDLLLVLDVLHLLQPHYLRLLHDLQREEAVGRVDDRAERWRRLLQCNAQVRRLTEAHAPEGAGT